jgi:hypothetical protein
VSTRDMERDKAAHLEGGYVEMGKVYRWHPKPPVVECECGRMLSTSGSTTSCPDCGADHMDPLRAESAEEGRWGNGSIQPWRYSKHRLEEERLPDFGLPYLMLPF